MTRSAATDGAADPTPATASGKVLPALDALRDHLAVEHDCALADTKPYLLDEALREARAAAIAQVRAALLRRLTVDGTTHDARRKDFHQAIFDADGGWAIWSSTDLGMVMDCFDKAAKDLDAAAGGGGR